MIHATGHTEAGKKLFVLGFAGEELAKLLDGEQAIIDITPLNLALVVVGRATEKDLLAYLSELGCSLQPSSEENWWQ